MKTKQLYYMDCSLRSFSAQVLDCQPREQGYAVLLDATAFYPEGGGQACDLGTLGSANVLDVQELDGEILHLCDGALEIGSEVTGCIQWERRFDLMQQHSGEHIVSGIVHSLLGHHNVGFHVGSDRMEIDFDGPITPEQLAVIEQRANEAVWDNLPITCYYPSEEELPNIFYRTKKALPWPVRLVQIPGVDSCACCGVHTATTGQIGLIKILSCVKFHQGVRIELACGQRAYRHIARVFEENRLSSQLMSVPMEQTADGVRKLGDALAAEKFRANQLQTQLFAAIAAGYSGRKDVIHFEDDLSSAQVRQLADKIVAVVEGFCAVFSENADGFSYCLATRDGDLRQLNKDMTAALNGRGGGKPNFQQGSLKATRAEIIHFFQS